MPVIWQNDDKMICDDLNLIERVVSSKSFQHIQNPF